MNLRRPSVVESSQQQLDPIRVLKNTRRSLLKLVANINAALAESESEEECHSDERTKAG